MNADERAHYRSMAIGSLSAVVEFVHAAQKVVRVCYDLDGLPERFTFEEADAFAELCVRAGEPERGQALLLTWANGDDESDDHAAHLATWGITGNSHDGWEATGEVVR